LLAVFGVPEKVSVILSRVFGGNAGAATVRRLRKQQRRWLFLRCFPLFWLADPVTDSSLGT
jgi:hypothetical protein